VTVDPVQPTVKAARIAGALYVLLIVTSLSAFIYTGALIVSGDATATANNILTSETLFRFSVIIELVAAIVFLFLVRALSRFLGGVNKGYASLMETFVYVSIPISFLSAVTQIAAAQLIHGASFLTVFNQNQLNALALVFLNLSNQISAANSIFFGLWLFPLGILVRRSGFIPRILGMLLFINGSAYLVNLFIQFVLPTYANAAFPVLAVLYLVGEPPFAAWLLIKGVKVRSSQRPLTPKQ
jgi:hypothetical protein